VVVSAMIRPPRMHSKSGDAQCPSQFTTADSAPQHEFSATAIALVNEFRFDGTLGESAR
jgi:hypothetical protein